MTFKVQRRDRDGWTDLSPCSSVTKPAVPPPYATKAEADEDARNRRIMFEGVEFRVVPS